MAFVEECRQYGAEGRQLVEETDAADADRVVAGLPEAGDDVRGVEDVRVGRRRLTAGEAGGEGAGMRSGTRGRRQEAGEEGRVGRERETPGGMPPLPPGFKKKAG